MAEEIRVTREGAAAAPPQGTGPGRADPARQLPAEAEAAHRTPEYDDPEHARAEIEATRARMSHTLDEIEDAFAQKRDRIRNRLDVFAPVRQNPWPAMAAALGAGIVIGLVTGGEDEEEEVYWERHDRGARWRHTHEHDYREEVLEARTRRLLAIARRQERELDRLRRGAGAGRRDSAAARLAERVEHRVHDAEDTVHEYVDSARGGLDDLRELVSDAVSSLARQTFRQLVGRR